ncbi:MAG TPA: GntR family transcriptional regulator [Clostridiales bacterium]|nr:GntR family transcriptional regulator [Clostridiales bacterium]
MTNEKPPRARYVQIALDIAQRIVNNEFKPGERLLGRSILAGTYNVSPETIRKAVGLLQNMDVVRTSQGSGTQIHSKEMAYRFLERFNYMESVESLKIKLEKLIQEKREIDKQLEGILSQIIDYSDRLKNVTPYNLVEIKVEETSKYIGKTIAELEFWQNTGGTILAIRRDDNIIISPGPYAEILSNDVLVVVGDGNVLENVNKFLNAK